MFVKAKENDIQLAGVGKNDKDYSSRVYKDIANNEKNVIIYNKKVKFK